MSNKKRYVIKDNSLPSRLKFGNLVLFWLLLDRFDSPEWLLTVYYTLLTILVVFYFYHRITTEEVEVDIESFLKDRGDAAQKKKEFFEKYNASN